MILKTHFEYRNVNYKAILGTKSSRMHVPAFKPFKLLATQEIKIQTLNQQQWHRTMSKNYHKIISQALRSYGIELAQKPCKKFHKEHKNIQIKRKNQHTYFYPFQKCKNTTKQSKIHQETHSNFLEIFVKKLTRTGVQVANIQVQLARNSKELKRSEKGLRYPAQTHTSDGSGSP